MNQHAVKPQLRAGVFKSPPVKVTEVNIYEFKTIRVGNMNFHFADMALMVYALPLCAMKGLGSCQMPPPLNAATM